MEKFLKYYESRSTYLKGMHKFFVKRGDEVNAKRIEREMADLEARAERARHANVREYA